MGYLSEFLKYKKICIQCHNNPDADTIAAAFGVYRYFQWQGVNASIVYGGEGAIKKTATKTLVKECHIPVVHTHEIEVCDLLLLVDCQCGAANVEEFPAEHKAVIDHHVQMVKEHPNYLIRSQYQSCSTIVYELLKEEGYKVKDDEELCIALLYGLYTDTASFSDLFYEPDVQMHKELTDDYPLFGRLIKSNMSIAELMVASDAMYHHFFNPKYHFAIVSAIKCDQTILGVIGDMVIQVDTIWLSFSYTEANTGYSISLRSCVDEYPANEIAAFVCDGIGGGGGHKKKAGGQIVKAKMIEKYGTDDVLDVINRQLCKYMEDILKKG